MASSPSKRKAASSEDADEADGEGRRRLRSRRAPVTPPPSPPPPTAPPPLSAVLAAALERPLSWRKVSAEGLDVDYCRLLGRAQADRTLADLERELDYFTGELARVFVFGKWHDIPRQQCSFGDPGLSYKFSGRTVPARPWPEPLLALRAAVEKASGTSFNFVLINRYRSGQDHMGEHQDAEKELDPAAPIASVSLGQPRDFVFRHRDARRPRPHKKDIPTVKLSLEHGSLLLMNPPTNQVWYHSLPPRKACPGVRVNLTFRRMLPPPPP
ncbi:hypothetical protein FOCC_FOCC000843 [Frankliniella occidentalis]|uniref:DNA oxidative demethylase ALKBH2 n=1 Tax=Frankliniella occidentalis TaxID=133901 RepID=A0A9C6U4U0_FRAOC|nr:DNA oxidative demethylase ALKBH2-like isoform X7 [Frankliniella occidentalis]KAE8752371.1 hypothetical protein FOCC_FOCC000843 [Frankliniella occidentalis]